MRHVIEVDVKEGAWGDRRSIRMEFARSGVELEGKPLGVDELDSVIEGLIFMKELLVDKTGE